MINKIFSWFESRINAYPDSAPQTPAQGLWGFIWSSLDGLKAWITFFAFLTIGVGIIEAMLFQFMGKIVDWLGAYSPATLWAEKGHYLIGMAIILLLSIGWIFLTSAVR